MARQARYRTAWWQFWRRPEPWWVDFPPPAPYWDWDEYEETKRTEALQRVARGLDLPEEVIGWRDTWPPSWTDEYPAGWCVPADQPVPPYEPIWKALDASPPVPAPKDEDTAEPGPDAET